MEPFLSHEVDEREFKKSDFKEFSFEDHRFTHCHFENCHFLQSSFKRASFLQCTFKQCHLQLIKMDNCRLQEVLFDECKLIGIDFHRCENGFFSIELKNCIAMSCNFSDLKMKRSSFFKSKLLECYFNNTYLCEANFRECDLKGSLFHLADLSHADFRGAINYAINPTTNKIKKALFSAPEVLSLLSFLEIKISD